MNGITIVALLACVAAAAAAPGHAYQAGYGFVAAGHGGHYGHSQPGVASVNAAQNTHSYNYGLNEHGPHYTKTVHQAGDFTHHVPVVAAAYPHAGYAHGYAGYAGHGLHGALY